MTILLSLTQHFNAAAENVVDLYGIESSHSDRVVKKYSKQVGMQLMMHNQLNVNDKSCPEKISGKDFGEYNIAAWEKWLLDEQHAVS